MPKQSTQEGKYPLRALRGGVVKLHVDTLCLFKWRPHQRDSPWRLLVLFFPVGSTVAAQVVLHADGARAKHHRQRIESKERASIGSVRNIKAHVNKTS